VGKKECTGTVELDSVVSEPYRRSDLDVGEQILLHNKLFAAGTTLVIMMNLNTVKCRYIFIHKRTGIPGFFSDIF
jgi:hypothetical protein